MAEDRSAASFDESPEERDQRRRERADKARPNVSMTPGQAETLAKSAAQGHGRCPECWGENGEHVFNCSKFYDPRADDAASRSRPPRIACVDGLHWLRSHEDGGAKMVYFDPPYGHGTFGKFDQEWIEDVLVESWRVIADDGIVYLHADPMLLWQLKCDLPLRGVVAWKNGWVSGFKSRSTKFWPRQYQVVAGFAKPTWRLRPVARPADEYRTVKVKGRAPTAKSFVYSDWWETPNPVDQMSWAKEKVGYPTQKPLALLERLILGSTDEGDLVMDPSCGSGTTVRAALNVGRDGYGADLSSEACEIARQRLPEAA